jgi:hypothetical protein
LKKFVKRPENNVKLLEKHQEEKEDGVPTSVKPVGAEDKWGYAYLNL